MPAASAGPSFAERFGNKISVTARDGSTKKLQSGEVERPAPSPRSRASMRGARPRSTRKQQQEQQQQQRSSRDEAPPASPQRQPPSLSEAQRAAANEAELAAMEEQEHEEAMLSDLAAQVQHQQHPSPVFEVVQPAPTVTMTSPRESSALARARARARPEAATGQPLSPALVAPPPELPPAQVAPAPAPAPPPVAAPVRSGGRPTVNSLHAVAGRSGVSYQPKTPTHVPGERKGTGYHGSPAAPATGSLPVPKLLAQTIGFQVPPTPPQVAAAGPPFSPDALDQFANHASADNSYPQPHQPNSPARTAGYGANPAGYGVAHQPQQQQPQPQYQQHQPAYQQPQQPMYQSQPANEWSDHPAMGGVGGGGMPPSSYGVPASPSRVAPQPQAMQSNYGGEAQHSPGGPRRRAARQQSEAGYSTKLEFAPSEVSKGSAPAAVFGGWNHYGAPPGPLQQGLHPEPQQYGGQQQQQYGGQQQQQQQQQQQYGGQQHQQQQYGGQQHQQQQQQQQQHVPPQVDMYVHHPAPEAALMHPPMGRGGDSPPLDPEEEIVTKKSSKSSSDRRREKMRQSAPLRMGPSLADQGPDGDGQAPFSAGGETEQERRSHTAGAQPTRGAAARRAGGGNGSGAAAAPRAGGNFYKSGYASKGGGSGSGGPNLGKRGAYKPGTLKEFKENDSGYKTRGGLGADLDNPELRAKQERAARAKEYAKAAQERAALLARHGGKAARIGERKEGPQPEPGRRGHSSGAVSDSAAAAGGGGGGGGSRVADDRHGGRQEWGKANDELERRQAARRKAKEYAAKVPKPKPRRLASPGPAAGGTAGDGSMIHSPGQEQQQPGGGALAGRRRGHGDMGAAADNGGGGGGGLPGYIDGLESAHREHQAAVARIKQELLR
jgi:hypothetical protein